MSIIYETKIAEGFVTVGDPPGSTATPLYTFRISHTNNVDLPLPPIPLRNLLSVRIVQVSNANQSPASFRVNNGALQSILASQFPFETEFAIADFQFTAPNGSFFKLYYSIYTDDSVRTTLS